MKLPLVSVAIANFNGARFIEDAIASALEQDIGDLEVIVVDDASTDDSVARARRMARRDPRVRVEALAVNGGAGAARNRAFDLARGRWFAVLDGDDLMHPSRLSRLVALAEREGADVAVDDLLVFREDLPGVAGRFLRGRRARAPSWITPEDFALENRIFGRAPNLGYLKPVIRLQPWRAAGVRYHEALPNAEDYDLLMQLLAAGLRCRLDPFLGYFYRKHASSSSHRLSAEALDRMVRADAAFRAGLADPPAVLLRALDRRLDSIRTARAFTGAVEALKARRPLAAVRPLLRRPKAALLFHMPLAARLSRLARRLAPARAGPPSGPGRLCIVSRQRLVGRTNGSSTYLLDIAQAARRAGLAPHLVQPSPIVLGRWPVLRLRPEMEVFETIALRGVFRAGRLVITGDTAVWLAAARGAAAKALERLSLPSGWLNARKAPYAPAAPWTDEDRLFVARRARGAQVLLADYVWQTEAFPYALTPAARTAVLMHDLFHRRAALFRQEAAADSVAVLDRDEELALLGRADAVLAIQREEAEAVKALLPRSEVVLAPMTARRRPAPQPGADGRLLFVGSNTAPNVLGMAWFFDRVWPEIRRADPDAALDVAGSVCRALGPAPEGVRYLGVVGDLEPLYAEAGVVISPLTAGSGLKIKLVEAMAEGKACVVTSVTLQGVEPELGGAVARADAPEAFARAVSSLLRDRAAREALGARALDAVRAGFSPETGHAALRDWLAGRTAGASALAPARLESQPAA